MDDPPIEMFGALLLLAFFFLVFLLFVAMILSVTIKEINEWLNQPRARNDVRKL